MTKIGEIIGCSSSTVCRVIKGSNVDMRDRGSYCRRHMVNEDIFSFPPKTEEQFYWLGFLMADGIVQKTWVSIKLQERDNNHLIKFRDFIGSDQIIFRQLTKDKNNKSHKTFPCVKIQINSAKIVRDLEKYNIIPNKVHKCEIIPELKNNRHFWRGMVDGDGSLFLTKTGNWVLSLTGSLDTITNFREFIFQFTNSYPKINKVDLTYFISYGGNVLVGALSSLLYKNSNIYLDRKKENALLLEENNNYRKSRLHINYDLIDEVVYE